MIRQTMIESDAGSTIPSSSWVNETAWQGLRLGLRSLQATMTAPTGWFLAALTAMLLRHPDVPFYEIDRVAFMVLVVGVAGRELVKRHRLVIAERVTWPMIGLAVFAIAGVATQPFDNQTWSLLAAKFIVPFLLFHLAILVFTGERQLRRFELFALLVLGYLCFTSIAFLVGAKSLIFPRFILDESLGYHVDRARGPLLQAVANGVSLNMLGVLALHANMRGRLRGVRALLLLAALPVAILATMTRAVWLSFLVSMGILIFRSPNRGLRRVCVAVAVVGVLGVLATLSFDDQRHVLRDRLWESGPLDFRQAVYAGCWQMFLEKPLAGWGANQMPEELARHVSGYKEKELYPHNTYLELLIEHGIVGLTLYLWLMWEMLRLGLGPIPAAESTGLLNQQFHAMWPVLLGIYWVNAALVVMNYQFVNGLLFTMAGMLAAQRRRAVKEVGLERTPSLRVILGPAS
jgi:putative inorganic carbon (hco3(-)) transporter